LQKKKVISIVWHQFLPANFGGQQTIADFNNALAKEVQLICICSNNNKAENLQYQLFNILPTEKLQFINPIVWYRIFSICKKEKPDYLLLEYCYHAVVAWLIYRFLKIRIIHSSHNIEYQRFKLLKKPYWRLLFLAEKWVSNFASINTFVTEQDRQLAINKFGIAKENSLVIPHTISRKNAEGKVSSTEKIRSQYQLNSDTPILLFNGTLDYLPNAKAVKNIAILLIPELRKILTDFVIIVNGRIENKEYLSLFNLTNEHLIITGRVDNIEDYFLAANVYINAVNIGAGVQTKTLEALSYNLNVVCFGNMLNGIEKTLVENKLFIAEQGNWEEFANKVVQALKQPNTITQSFFEYYSYQSQLSQLINHINNNK